MSSSAPVVRHLDDVLPKLISPADTVRLATLVRPSDGTDTSVFFEVWEPPGACVKPGVLRFMHVSRAWRAPMTGSLAGRRHPAGRHET
jgi:hypothetical protein